MRLNELFLQHLHGNLAFHNYYNIITINLFFLLIKKETNFNVA